MTTNTFRALLSGLLLLGCAQRGLAQDHRVLPPGERPEDARLGPLVDLNGYFPFEVPESVEAWEARSSRLKTRLRVALGLVPMPPRTPLRPVIHGRVERPGFTVDRVYFESIPGHFVTGLLFRPQDGKQTKRPAVLCPHGHGGRLQDYGERKIKELIADGAERFEASGRFPKLARCAHLARMGCVTFIFDMLGYADSQQISRALAHGIRQQRPDFEGPESWGLFSAQAEMRLQSVMGIQTWNSIRCLDFLESLPEVDKSRIAVTGGSGGGTQTILLCALDDRPIAAFPNGMVSTAMQGGCTCENCSLLRVDAGNVELAALFAPKPQAMTAADDWTKEMLSKGFPQLQQLYSMLGASGNVACRDLRHFPHNYNYVSRATMYRWFNQHLELGLSTPFLEEDYELLSPEELTVWNDDHPAPPGGPAYERQLTKQLAELADKQLRDLAPHDRASFAQYKKQVGDAVGALLGRSLVVGEVERRRRGEVARDGYVLFKSTLHNRRHGEVTPVVTLWPGEGTWNGDVVVWVTGVGKAGLFDGDQPIAPVQALLAGGAAVVGADLFQQGEFLAEGESPPAKQRVVSNPREVAAYTYCYNHPLFARRCHDVLTVVGHIARHKGGSQLKRLHLVGTAGAGPIAAAVGAVAGDALDATVVDAGGFRFGQITSYRDPDFLPGVVKYGDVPGLLALSAPRALTLVGERVPPSVQQCYAASGQPGRVKTATTLASAVSNLLDQVQ